MGAGILRVLRCGLKLGRLCAGFSRIMPGGGVELDELSGFVGFSRTVVSSCSAAPLTCDSRQRQTQSNTTLILIRLRIIRPRGSSRRPGIHVSSQFHSGVSPEYLNIANRRYKGKRKNIPELSLRWLGCCCCGAWILLLNMFATPGLLTTGD